MDMMSYTSGESSCSSASSIGGGEFEVARVLASLGNNNGVAAATVEEEDEEMRESGSVGCGNSSWGFKGKRSSSCSNKLRVKESSSIHNSSPLPFDLNVVLNSFSLFCISFFTLSFLLTCTNIILIHI